MLASLFGICAAAATFALKAKRRNKKLHLLKGSNKFTAVPYPLIECTFVKCRYNNYGRSRFCLAKTITMGGLSGVNDPSVKPVCLQYEGVEFNGDENL